MPSYNYRGTVAQLRAAIRHAVGIMTGREGDQTGLAEGINLRIGTVALSLIKDAFVAKARGGTDAAGISWPKLQPKTIAYGRRHPGLNKIRQKAALKGQREGTGHAKRPLLSDQQDKQWRRYFSNAIHGLVRRGVGAGTSDGTATPEIKAHAAAYAWQAIKAEGGKTILGEYGNTEVEILRDTGVLLNSLSPVLEGNPGEEQRVLRSEPGASIVGSNVQYAGRHHRGDPAKNLPKRPLWPQGEQWPQDWREEEAEQIREGGKQLVLVLVRGEIS